MLLAVDIGNTNTVIGFMEGRRVRASYRIATRAGRTADEYGMILTDFLRLSSYEPADMEGVIIASVVPKVMHSLPAAIVRYLSVEPLVVGPGVKTGVNIRLDDPKSLGADCLADCVGAHESYEGPLLVADFGTATTFNYVDAQGSIRSGLITVGIDSGAKALWSQTAQLPEVELTRPSSILTTGTRDAMQAGLYYNFLGGLERIILQFRREIDNDFQVIATGGLGRIFASETDLIDHYDPELIFRGMATIYSRTMQAAPTAK
ncbi:pantothenate kinase [Bifidobacterium actinocoloniiforme DSM 22766]|uniref:Type III pantothenate kinase n=1 Tax=Bifidobacterium actinocoloniiforme DSM 22766 TaxID=1437605 RepID=A0A086Z1C0_9BIFI|nr:type III pantothenate kinase [Bifidobacterium actinocoloniiforme]AKV55475.1 pantothenate kinase [Bifidobacterium actinocoloniiforme DSM 22766]KFI40320.1 pantothenate kinase [Bifidobacterium actinocoloniiforme DSM 22766]